MRGNTKKVKVNRDEGIVLPKPPVPYQVRTSVVETVPPPISKVSDGIEVVAKVEPKVEVKKEEVVSKEKEVAKGTITIQVFLNTPYKVEFSGSITGGEIDTAWRAMMKGYRVWKHELIDKSNNDGGV